MGAALDPGSGWLLSQGDFGKGTAPTSWASTSCSSVMGAATAPCGPCSATALMMASMTVWERSAYSAVARALLSSKYAALTWFRSRFAG